MQGHPPPHDGRANQHQGSQERAPRAQGAEGGEYATDGDEEGQQGLHRAKV